MRASPWIYLTLALSLVAFGGASDALAEVYRWKDSKGVVHFGDRPVSTDPRVVQEVAVPKPNLANAFKPDPNAVTAVESPPPAPNPVNASQPPTEDLGIAAKSRTSCEAKVAAYKASKVCFARCSKANAQGGTNTAACGHCTEQTMPQCWSRN